MIVVKWYTRASRVRIMIAKFDGRWKIPGGPYTIPEATAAVSGILATLFSLTRFGQPIVTALVGVVGTLLAVALMRQLPYSPVGMGTRVLRIVRLYRSPTSSTSHAKAAASIGSDRSIIRPRIVILDPTQTGFDPLVPPAGHRKAKQPIQPVRATELVEAQPSPATALFN